MSSSVPRFSQSQEEVLLRFDAHWNQPTLEQMKLLFPSDAEPALIFELICIDAQKRHALGRRFDEALYLEAFPQLFAQNEWLEKLRGLGFPKGMGDSVLRALLATTPQLHQLQLPAVDHQATTVEETPSSSLPAHRYKLEGEIARGGMGAVLRARDEDLGREIAVKVMLQNHAGKTELLQRFVEEAQIAGQLQHPGITPIYEMGQFLDQRPYFTMKLVRGQTLSKVLKERSEVSIERSRFLKIFEQICQTLAYAHARKVIHRDLKPHNIMVGAFGEVQVMDWGLAKVLRSDSADEVTSGPRASASSSTEGKVQTRRSTGQSTNISDTQAGSVLGTPAYMAPEQAQGHINQLDERADVFGLGAILCEILTGKPPYSGESGLEIYRQAVAASAEEAFHRLDGCGADLELISLAKRCLSGNREERPRDAGVLTKQLTAYLHSVEDRLKQAELQAVQARTKADEETKRRRITLRLAAAILLTLLAGLGISSWQMQRARIAEELARKNETTAKNERDEKEIQRQKATDNEQLAKRRLVHVENGIDVLTDLIKDINPRIEKLGGPTIYETLASRTLEASKKLETETMGDPLALSKMQTALGLTLRELGKVDEAVVLLRKALSVREQQLGPEHIDTMLTMNLLGNALQKQGKHAESQTYLDRVHQTLLRQLGPNHLDTLVALANVAMNHLDNNQPEKAIGLLEKALRDGINNLEEDNEVRLTALHNLSNAYHLVGRMDKALPLLEQVKTVKERKWGVNHIDTLETMHSLARYYEVSGDLGKALPLFDVVLAGFLKKLGPTHTSTLTVRSSLAEIYAKMNRLPEATTQMEGILKVYQQLHGPEHTETLRLMNSLADIYRLTDRTKEGIALLEQARIVVEKKYAPDTMERLNTESNLAAMYWLVGRGNDAIGMMEQVCPVIVKRFGLQDTMTINSLYNLAEMYRASKKIKEALPIYESVMQGMEKRKFQHERSEEICRVIPGTFENEQQFSQVESFRRQWLAVVRAQHGSQHEKTAIELVGLSHNLLVQKKGAEAEPLLREGLAIRQKQQPKGWRTFNTMSLLGEALLQTKKYTEAESFLTQGFLGLKASLKDIPPQGIRFVHEGANRLIHFYTETNKPTEVKKWQVEKEKLPKLEPTKK